MDKKLRTPIAAIMLLVIAALHLLQCTGIHTALFGYRSRLDVLTIISIAIELALCFTLFSKKRNNILVAVLGLAALLQLFYLISYVSIFNLLIFAAYALLLVFALAVCEQTFIKTDFSKIKELASKLFYLPAIIYIAASAYNWVSIMRIPDVLISLLGPVSSVLNFVAMLSLAMWLTDPYSKQATNSGTYTGEGYGEAYCGLGKHIVLCLFTFGIWYLIWTYRTTKFLNKAPGVQQYNPTSKLLLCLFVPFYQIYWFYKHGQRIDTFSKHRKLNHSDMATLCLILGIFIPIVACIIMQDRINAICTAKAIVEEQKFEDSATEQLKKYKELLDSGVISQEEFEAKKKQLLGL